MLTKIISKQFKLLSRSSLYNFSSSADHHHHDVVLNTDATWVKYARVLIIYNHLV
jgi:hypothetical protein